MKYSFEFLLNYAEVIKIWSYCILTQGYRFTPVCVCIDWFSIHLAISVMHVQYISITLF